MEIVKFKNVYEANLRIADLETKLGLTPGPKMFNVRKMSKRIEELEALVPKVETTLAQAAAQITMHPSVPPAATLAEEAVIQRFLEMSPQAREQFSSDGGTLTIDAFNALSPQARRKHHAFGGKITAGETKLVRRFDPDRPAHSNGLMSLETFNNLGKNDQATFLRLGGCLAR